MRVGIAVYCTVCGLRKNPIGRAGPVGLTMCDHECPGYRTDPLPGSLWPGETEEQFGFPISSDGTQEQP